MDEGSHTHPAKIVFSSDKRDSIPSNSISFSKVPDSRSPNLRNIFFNNASKNTNTPSHSSAIKISGEHRHNKRASDYTNSHLTESA